MSDEVIILGAGSSKSYGFPTGDEILNIIINGEIILDPDEHHYKNRDKIDEIHDFNHYYKDCIKYYIDKYEYDDKKFRDDLKISGTKTIDTYLSNSKNKEDESFGKFAISSIISFYENINQMKKHSDDNWMDYFFNQKISYQLQDFKENPPQIITFNYDTFFEHKLVKHLQKEHSFKDADTFVISKEFITHVYENLNNATYKEFSAKIIPTYEGDKIIHRKFEDIDFAKIENDSTRITFIRANSKENKKVNQIRTILSNAKKIYILGYGFDKFNNEILFQNEDFFYDNTKEIYYTGFGLEESLKRTLNDFDTVSTPTKNNMKCLELLKLAMPHKLFPKLKE